MAGDRCGPLTGCVGDELAPDLDTQLAMTRMRRWAGIELRSVDGRMIAELDDEQFDRVVRKVAASGVRVLAVDSNIGGWGRSVGSRFAHDTSELDILARRAPMLGTRRIRIMSWQNEGRSAAMWRAIVLRRVAALALRAERHGLELLHENCAGWGGVSPGHALELVEHAASPSLRLLFDTGNGLTYGYDAVSYLAPIAHLVEHVHVKDGRSEGARVRYLAPGRGSAGVSACMRLLIDAGYDGPWVLEPHFGVAPHDGRLRTSPSQGRRAWLGAGEALRALLEEEGMSSRRTPAPVVGAR